MDVQGAQPDAPRPGARQQDPAGSASRFGALTPARVGRALGEWQAGELRLARSFGECRGLGREQLEDLYQETTIVLLGRPFHNEEHLRNALRWGIKHRALHLHRDERRRGEILSHRAPELQLAAEGREQERTPELAALLDQDRVVVAEFLTELSALERNVFWMMAEGMRYRAIAPVLEIPINEARKASRSCERKRARFQLLYDTGRLCGYRSHTIQALQAGQAMSEELALGAYAHLEGCAQCRAEHRTNARRLRRSFQGQAAALLPIPVLTGRLGWLARVGLRARTLHHRLAPYSSAPGSGGMRERTVAMLTGGGAAAKLAAGVATVAVIAGGTLGASRVLQRHSTHRRHRAAASATARQPAVRAAYPAPASTAPAQSAPRETPAAAPRYGAHPHAGASREPGGFAFLGVPGGGHPGEAAPRAAAATATTVTRAPAPAGGSEQRSGGPFSP
jgi:RNA polymerase sigma factor (sigma-70 family)